MKPAKHTWYIINPRNSNQVLHDVGGAMEWWNFLNPMPFTVRGRRVMSKPVTYKTANGALKRSQKMFPEMDEHSAQTECYLLERVGPDGCIWSYKNQWEVEKYIS